MRSKGTSWAETSLDNDGPWSGILSANDFATRSMYHTTLQATPVQLVFGYDTILNNPFIADWEYIRLSKQKIIENNQLENKNCKPHRYIIRDKVLVRNQKNKKLRGAVRRPLYDIPSMDGYKCHNTLACRTRAHRN